MCQRNHNARMGENVPDPEFVSAMSVIARMLLALSCTLNLTTGKAEKDFRRWKALCADLGLKDHPEDESWFNDVVSACGIRVKNDQHNRN